ncbi:MAG: GGDEF domain-containing protein [Thermodesulfobacteriota bacterium]
MEYGEDKNRGRLDDLQTIIDDLQAANKKMRQMLNTAEQLAYFAKDIKMLDIDEIFNLTTKKIPELFAGSNISIFLLQKEDNISRLRLIKATHIEDNIEWILDKGGCLPVKEIIKDISGTVIEERELSNEQCTPIQKAMEEDAVLIIPDVQKKSKMRFLNKKRLGRSCIVIPFIVQSEISDRGLYVGGVKGAVTVGGVLNISGLDIESADMEFIRYKASLIKDILGANISNAMIFSETKKMAITDSLTGLYNNRMLSEFLNRELDRTKRYANVFSVVVCDIDNFKRINDEYGHLTGDMVLRGLANLMDRTKRDSDMLFRYGGEEFVFILPETNVHQAYPLIERIRGGIEKARFDKDISSRLTLSFGISQYPYLEKDEDAKEILHRADIALYTAKNKGKNRVELFT